MAAPTIDAVRSALAGVKDPEIGRPLADLGMIKDVRVSPDGAAQVAVWLTVAGCPMKDTLTRDVTAAVSAVPGISAVQVELDVMSAEQRRSLQERLGGGPSPEIPFARAGSLTRVYAVASGKGGVGKSTVTVNVAASLAARGLSVGVVDADIYGFSVPRMLGVTGRPTRVESMMMPPQAHGIRVMSMGMFIKDNAAVAWRGPMLHRALQQFLADTFWGELDILLMDLPPGTGDIAISTAHMIPNAELLVVTTPQPAAAEVAERAGSIALQTHQRIVGVVENMSWLPMPNGERMEIFGSGGGKIVSGALTRLFGTDVPLLGQIPMDTALREGADRGMPLVLSQPDSPAALALSAVADRLAVRRNSLIGQPLGLSPATR